MSENLDLEQVITDSVNDAVSDVDYADDAPIDDTPAVEASSEPSTAPTDASVEPTEATPQSSTQVVPTANQPAEQAAEPKDAFADLAGVPQMGVTGRENRIPYSRVKKITEKAAFDAESKIAETVIGRKLNQGEKPADVVKQHLEQIPQLTSRVQDYEGRLNTVGQFENVMANDPEKFLGMLAKLPAYKQFFQFVETAYDTMQKASAQPQASGQQPVQPSIPQPVSDDMPQPDEKLPDGSAVYSMNGLRNLITWTQTRARAEAVAEATKQFDARYKALESRYEPIQRAWQEHQTRQSVMPLIQAQIAEAKTWPMFNELEPEITKLLEQNKTMSLEAAYRAVAFPRMQADRNSMRQQLLKELQQAPVTTSVNRPGVKPLAPTAGPRSMEQIIAEEVEKMKAGGRQ